MNQIVAKIVEFVKANLSTILIVAIMVLLALFSFASGYIMAKYQDRAPIIINSKS